MTLTEGRGGGKESVHDFSSETHPNKDPNVICWNEVRNMIVWFQDLHETTVLYVVNGEQAM